MRNTQKQLEGCLVSEQLPIVTFTSFPVTLTLNFLFIYSFYFLLYWTQKQKEILEQRAPLHSSSVYGLVRLR